jgi:hypothetical protein
MTTRQWAELQRQAEVIEQERKRISRMTPVEWLMEINRTREIDKFDWEQALKMEEQLLHQCMMDAWNEGIDSDSDLSFQEWHSEYCKQLKQRKC